MLTTTLSNWTYVYKDSPETVQNTGRMQLKNCEFPGWTFWQWIMSYTEACTLWWLPILWPIATVNQYDGYNKRIATTARRTEPRSGNEHKLEVDWNPVGECLSPSTDRHMVTCMHDRRNDACTGWAKKAKPQTHDHNSIIIVCHTHTHARTHARTHTHTCKTSTGPPHNKFYQTGATITLLISGIF